MIDATATLEQPGAIKIHVVMVAPTLATVAIYAAIAESMKDPGHGKMVADFKDGAIILDIELHSDEHVDHLEALKEAAENVGKSVVAAGKEVVAAAGAGIHAIEQEVENLAHAAHNEANKLVGHQGPGPNEDKGAEANSDPDALGKLAKPPEPITPPTPAVVPEQPAGLDSPGQVGSTEPLVPLEFVKPTEVTKLVETVEPPVEEGTGPLVAPSAEDLDKAAAEQRIADATAGLPMDGADQPAR